MILSWSSSLKLQFFLQENFMSICCFPSLETKRTKEVALARWDNRCWIMILQHHLKRFVVQTDQGGERGGIKKKSLKDFLKRILSK